MALSVLLSVMVTSLILMPTPHVAEQPAEWYWKRELGNETPIPRIVKDALNGPVQYRTSFVLTDPLKANINIGKEIIYSFDQHRQATNQVKPLHYSAGRFHVTEQEKVDILIEGVWYYGHPKGVQVPVQRKDDIGKGEQLWFSNKQKSFKVTDQQKDTINQIEHTIDPTQHVTYVTEKDLTHPGTTLKLHFVNGYDDFKFLPNQLAKLIPFTSAKLPKLLKFFNVRPNADEAEIIEDSLMACEKKIEGENKYCATSLEGMVDFVTTFIGHNVSILSSYSDHEINQEQKIASAKRVGNDANIVCHKMGYPYAVFYCHNTKNTVMYDVSLVGNDGKKMSGVVVCHRDTSTWSSDHIAFRILNVKPGSPLCHFLDGRSMAWVPK